MAGGVGSRLRPLTENIPKPLVPVANKPMIDYSLELLRNNGITRNIIIVTKFMGNKIRRYLDQAAQFDDLEYIIPNVNPVGTADAVRLVADLIDTERFIVSMADIITNVPITDFQKFHEEKNSTASITLKDIAYPRAFGVIMLNKESRILLFLEKPLPQELNFVTLTFAKKQAIRLQSNLVNTGLYCFNREILGVLDRLTDLTDFGKDILPYLAREYGVYGYERRDYYWMDAGNPQTYLYSNWDVLRRWAFPHFPRATAEENGVWYEGPRPDFSSSVQLQFPLVLGRDLELGDNTKIGPLTAISDRVRIGKDTTIEASVIWHDVHIGSKTTIKESIVCNDVVIPDGSHLAQGTVIAPGVHLTEPVSTQKGEIIRKIE
ncbi:MAG: sugar phosphate nucleotidyltransferase [Candidatus Thorarchaeota archaeon]